MTDTRATPAPGQRWAVAKVRPDGTIAARYEATELPAPPNWVVVRARWVYGRVDIGHYAFEPGDTLDEYFALDHYYNAFATYRQSGEFVGWYCNVTHPTRIVEGCIYWDDLYVDVLVLPDGTVHIVDEDELAESGLAESDPALHAAILKARDELLALIRDNAYPFSEVPLAVSRAIHEDSAAPVR